MLTLLVGNGGQAVAADDSLDVDVDDDVLQTTTPARQSSSSTSTTDDSWF
jgi:hypothetical protein